MAALPTLLQKSLADRQWTVNDLHAALRDAGCDLTYAAVHNWVTGRNSIRDKHKPVLAQVLGISLGDLTVAAAAQAA